MPSTRDLDMLSGLKIQLNGKPGAGKTGMAGSFHTAGKIKFFDFDGKLHILKSLYPNIDIEYESYGADNYNKFLNDWEALQTNCPYKTVVVDSFTALSNTCVVFQLMTKGKMGKMTKGGVQVTGYEEINGETALVTKMLEIMKITVAKFKTNFIWTTHPVARMEGIGDDARRTSTIAAYGFKVPSIVPAYFNEIYNIKTMKKDLEGKNFKRIAFTSFCNDDDSVRSVIQLPNELDVSDFNLYQKIQDHLKRGNSTA